MAIPDLLKDCTLFLELYDREIERIVKDCQVFCYEKGQKIIETGHKSHEVYVILDGSVEIQRSNEDGQIIRLQTLRKGNLLGEAALLEERDYRSDVVAKSTVALLEIPYDVIFSRFRAEPRVFGIMMLNLSRMLARRLREGS